MKTFNENVMIQDLNLQEQKEVNGGIGVLTGILIGAGVALVIDQWPDIKRGVSDAWNGI
ncbi:MAG: hypothetical protein ACRC8J_02410 [Phocaeicola sp.]